MKENLSGNFVVLNTHMVDDLMKLGLWDEDTLAHIKHNDGSLAKIDGIPQAIKNKYLEVFEIDPQFVVEAAARRQKWIDQSCSTNVFLKTTSGKMLSETYMNVWKMGMKTTYYLRTLAASQITKTHRNQDSRQSLPCEVSSDASAKTGTSRNYPRSRLRSMPIVTSC